MFTYYSLPWLTVSYTLPVVYSRLVWHSMMYPSVYARELWKAYWKSNLSAIPSVSVTPEEPVVTVVSEEIIKVELVPLVSLPLEPVNVVEEKPLITIVETVQTSSVSPETLPQTLPSSPRQKPENYQRVIRLLQSYSITQLEDINRLTLDRTKSLAKALGIAQSVQGQKKKTAVLKDEVKQKLLDFALLEEGTGN